MNKNKITLNKLIQIILHLLLNVYNVSQAGNLSSGQYVGITDVAPEQAGIWLESEQRSDLRRSLVHSKGF